MFFSPAPKSLIAFLALTVLPVTRPYCATIFTPKSLNSDFYWKKWIDITKIGEENRFAYVAISRAKYLFVLAIPKDKNYTVEYKKKFEDLGFEIL